jgi:hypothetical protein
MMSKYEKRWKYLQNSGDVTLKLSFEEINVIKSILHSIRLINKINGVRPNFA